MEKILSYLTLNFIKQQFRDNVSGKMVSLYRDCYGNEFLKDGRWSFFAIRKGGIND